MNFDDIIKNIYTVLLPKLNAQDIDQEVKEEAINCSAILITNHGLILESNSLKECLNIYKIRLGNEITRLTTVKALEVIAKSSLQIDMTLILIPCIEQITTFLRLNNRQLKQSSLNTLNVFFELKNPDSESTIRSVLENLAPLISEEDLHLSHLALRLAGGITTNFPSCTKMIKELLFPRILLLLQSKVLQGHALENILILFKAILVTRTNGFGFTHISKAINNLMIKDSTRKCLPACAQCIGVLCASSSEKKRASVLTNYVTQISTSGGGNEQQTIIALSCIGEIGRRIDFCTHTKDIEKLISQQFNEQSEEIKSAAAIALGNLAVGNLSKFLPFILNKISECEDTQYLLLLALREVITRLSKTSESVSDLISQLNTHNALDGIFNYCHSSKEGVRNVVSECVGRLAAIHTENMLDKIIQKLSSDSSYERSTACSSIKFALTDNQKSVEELLLPKINLFLNLLKDSNVDVRRSALLTFNFLVHNRPALIFKSLDECVPMVYEETKENTELLRKVKVGPFTHVVDDGLENRKAAFECMYTLMETCLGHLNLSNFISNLVHGLDDTSSDIKSMCHIMLEHLAKSQGPAVVQALDSIIEPLRNTLDKKPKDSAVKQDKERYEELVRSALRAIHAISQIPGSDTNTKFTEFMKFTVNATDIKEKYQALTETTNNENMMDTSN